MYNLGLPLLIIISAITATLAQIVLLREMAVVFDGSELSYGVFLSSWLFWTGIGSFTLGRLTDRLKQPINVFVSLQASVSIIILVEIFLIRCTRFILGIGHGITIDIVSMLLVSFCVLIPLCLLNGFLFAIACRIYKEEKRNQISDKDLALPVGRVYLLDSIGGFIAGTLFTYCLVYYFHSFQLVFYLILINLLICLLVEQIAGFIRVFLVFGIVICLLSILTSADNTLHKSSKSLQWQGYDLVESQDSIYGNIAVTKEGNYYSFYENGVPFFSIPNQASNEELINLALIEHPCPKQILIIGGGIELLKEACKYPLQRVYYIEFDPLITRIAMKYLLTGNTSNKEHIWYGDARFFIKTAKQRFDLIMVNLPDPSTAQLNRFYTQEFFLEAKRILTKNGVISISVSSNENYLSQEMRNLNTCIYRTLKGVFPYCVFSPGDRLFFFASTQPDVVSDNPDLLAKRFIERKVKSEYINQYYFANRFYPERVNFIHQQLEIEKTIRINKDFNPICYYYNLALWSSQFNINSGKIFNWASNFKIIWFLAILGFLLIGQIVLSRKKPEIHRASIPLAIAATGFAGISLEIVLIFTFQVLYGYAYHRIGIIIAAFMVGLVLGVFYINKKIQVINCPKDTLSIIQGAIFTYCFLLPLIFFGLSFLKNVVSIFVTVEILFPVLTIIIGALVGLQFPLANQIYLHRDNTSNIGQQAGLVYAADLLGACLGAFLSSIFFIPILGIFQTCFICGLINMAALILIRRSK